MTSSSIVFTMPGKYTRFQAFGHKVPKYLLPISTGTVLSKVVQSLCSGQDNNNLYFIANHADKIFVPVIKSIIKSFGEDRSELIFIDDTAGQLETASCVSRFTNGPHNKASVCSAW